MMLAVDNMDKQLFWLTQSNILTLALISACELGERGVRMRATVRIFDFVRPYRWS